jgi:hypothetical protein
MPINPVILRIVNFQFKESLRKKLLPNLQQLFKLEYAYWTFLDY